MIRNVLIVVAVLAVTIQAEQGLYEREQELYQEVLNEPLEKPLLMEVKKASVDGAAKLNRLRGNNPNIVMVQSRSTSPSPSYSSRRRASSSSRRRASSSSRRRASYSSRRRGHVVVVHGSRRRRRGYVHYSSSGGGCFPSDATVESKKHGIVPISSIAVGDEVMTHSGYSEVLFFAVHQPEVEAEHIKITTSTKTLVLTGSHAVFDHTGAAKLAAKVRVGDSLLTAGVVEKIEHQQGKGLIAPVTSAGSLKVEGVSTSDYGPMAEAWGHRVAHAAVVPLRMLRWVLPSSHKIWHSHDKDGKHTFMNWGTWMLSFLGH